MCVGQFIFFSLYVGLPLSGVLPCTLGKDADRRHNFWKNVKKRSNNKVNEARLRLTDVGSVSVAKEGHGQRLVLFEVALCEKLVEKEVGPLVSHVEGPRLGRNIRSVYTYFKQLLFAIELFCWVWFIDQILSIFALFNFILFNNWLESGQVCNVPCHIGG